MTNMDYNFDKVIPREGTSCEKYDLRGQLFGNPELIPLWIADMDFETPDFIVEAMNRRMRHPVFGYSFRDEDYNSAIVGWVGRRSSWTIDPAWLDFTPGVVAGIVFALRALTGEGDKVVIQTPVYAPFSRVTGQNKRSVVCNSLIENNGVFSIDFDDLDAKLADAKIMLLCNPHNPTGRVLTKDELERIGSLCIKHKVTIVSDEIHSDIIQKPFKHTHISSLSDEIAQQTITLIAPSKTFNLAGLSTSVAIIPNDELRKKFRDEFMKMHADQGNILGSVALEAAYRFGDEWVDQMNVYVGRNMDLVVDFMAANLPEIGCRKSEGTYMMWLDMRHYLETMSSKELTQLLIHKAGIGLSDGRVFGAEGHGWYRINVASPRSIIEKALAQLKYALGKL